jgi:hypothetical protein
LPWVRSRLFPLLVPLEGDLLLPLLLGTASRAQPADGEQVGQAISRGRNRGLLDRSSRSRLWHPLEQIVRVEVLRHQVLDGGAHRADHGPEPCHRQLILTRLKLNKMWMLEFAAPILRYEHDAPGDRLHLDIKKLARLVAALFDVNMDCLNLVIFSSFRRGHQSCISMIFDCRPGGQLNA